MNPSLIPAKWPAPTSVHAYTTTRMGGNSSAPYHSFNLAQHVGDNKQTVEHNRQQLQQQLGLPQAPAWLQQIHGNTAVCIDHSYHSQADASYSQQAKQVCVVLTADCLPLLVCNQQGTEIAAIHAGWRGLANQIITKTIQQLQSSPTQLMVCLGPAISQGYFEVGIEVYQTFIQQQPESIVAFKSNRPQHWLADMYVIAKQQLQQLGIQQIYGGEYCTYSQADLFYSYRREPSTGRMASLIWMD